MRNYKIAFFDIDGTLADNELPREWGIYRRIPQSAREAVKKLGENGIITVIASGRHMKFITDFSHKLGVTSLISSNGAYVTHEDHVLAKHPMSDQLVERLVQQLVEKEITFLFETSEKVQLADEVDHQKFIVEHSNQILQLICRVSDSKHIDVKEPEVIAEKVAPIAANIHMGHVSKATGVKEMLQLLNISPEEAVAFGDEENDLTMFEVVGMPVAMGNATKLVKDKAKHVTDCAGEDGIWKACVHLGLIED
ncbi:phosphatase [Enterococcus florum]|uniref:Phosphatase n=1 Tax=Enterococcus florum TaxID=2480627 RepID=A0A4P5PHX4_9ENTE|nr:HAD family hydrolase [Enterococcus florum]GCF95252.1 phosphatase [Enterococcus florum]